MRYLFSVSIIFILLCSCDHIENPYPPQVSIDLDTNLYPGLWSDYESNEWPLFGTNPNTLRNVIIEDFTGHTCNNCPAVADYVHNLYLANPTRIYNVAIHAGTNGLDSFQEVDLPDYGSVLTPNDRIPIKAECSGIDFDLTSSDGRIIVVEDNEIKFATPGTVGVIGLITGIISCDEGTPIDVIHEFEILGNIPIETKFTGSIPIVESTTIEIPVEVKGNQSQMWLVGTDGPLSRIATTENNHTYHGQPGDRLPS